MTWTNARLDRLFTRCRLRYWPASRRLCLYRVEVASLQWEWGKCDFEGRVLSLDASRHSSDREVRATLLHEMVHAVVGRPGHGAPFWTQLEYLLARRAPITLSFPELGEWGKHLCVIPVRFRRCRRLFAPIYRRWQREIERKFKGRSKSLMPVDLETECEDAAIAGSRWLDVWTYQARGFGFVDLDGRLLPWARNSRDACRRGYLRGRRFFLQDERARRRFFEAAKTPAISGVNQAEESRQEG